MARPSRLLLTFPIRSSPIYSPAHMDWGKFRDALDYGHHQLGISEELDNPQMRSEAYLNLARAHERLGEFM